jgi:hypothetical protein
MPRGLTDEVVERLVQGTPGQPVRVCSRSAPELSSAQRVGAPLVRSAARRRSVGSVRMNHAGRRTPSQTSQVSAHDGDTFRCTICLIRGLHRVHCCRWRPRGKKLGDLLDKVINVLGILWRTVGSLQLGKELHLVGSPATAGEASRSTSTGTTIGRCSYLQRSCLASMRELGAHLFREALRVSVCHSQCQRMTLVPAGLWKQSQDADDMASCD